MKFSLVLIFFIVVLIGCSTEKNTLINRTYHGTTAHYNGYFNANDLLNQSLISYKTNLKEDFYSMLPLSPAPNEEEVKGMYPAIDTAIAKCMKVISKHSMPTASEPSKKRDEFNRWIDENWLTIGISNFYRRDYEMALKSFSYIKKFYHNDPSNYTAAIWMAKTQISLRDYTEASLILQQLDKDIEELEQQGKQKKSLDFSKFKGKKSKKKPEPENKKAEFPKKSRFLFELTKAELALVQDDPDKAIESLEKSLEFCKKSKDKARVHFILAQLNAGKSDSEKAKYHYTKVLKYNAPFEMNFNARINRALMGGDSKIKNELQKMLRDEKNAEFKDQIYYALADIALKEGNKEQGIEYLHKSVIFSVSNNRQKAISYEKLGNMNFEERNYVSAQKYYDSCVTVLPEKYPNADGIRNKALKLKDLVVAVETAQYEDSVQRIAGMSPEDQLSFAQQVIQKIKAEEKRKKEQDDIRLKQIQDKQALAVESQSSNKFFWNSPKLKSEGLETFRKAWGARENEDDWRRSEKIVAASFKEDETDSLNTDLAVEAVDSLTPESLLANIPSSDSLLSDSKNRMLSALYDAGMIYKDQLNEPGFASKQFEEILNRKIESKFNVLALYQLYKIYEVSDPQKSYQYKNEILISYPNSDYASYLRDPEFFVKRKELEKLAEDDYLKVLDRYNRGLYSIVTSSCDRVIAEDQSNKYRSKYMLLKALSVGQSATDKKEMIPFLKDVIAAYPGTMEETKAKELIEIIEKGYSAFEENKYEKKSSIYTYRENDEHLVLIFIDKKESSSTNRTKVSDFNKEYYGNEKLNVTSKIFGDDENVLVIKTFDELSALEYISSFKRTKKYVTSLQDFKIVAVSQDNLKVLFETQNLAEYEQFYAEFY